MKRRPGRHEANGLIVITNNEDREPAFRCMACGLPFFEQERTFYQRHVVACSAKHEQEMRAESIRERMPGLATLDDYDVWISKHRDELIAGRKKL